MVKQSFNSPEGEITWITIRNKNGASVTLSNLGAGIINVIVPDRDGAMVNVALGYKSPLDYIQDGPNCGKTPGRFANRIARGIFSLNGVEYHLPVNLPPNHLHGGPQGFANKFWTIESASDSEVVFSLISPDGDMGYPGTVSVKAVYRWTDLNTLEVTYSAVTDKPTVVNLTNHAYWNLNGAGTALNHTLQMNASEFLDTDSFLTPTGTASPVSGTPMDFTEPKVIGRDMNADFAPLKWAKGYDHCMLIDNADPHTIRPVAQLTADISGITMRVESNAPAAMLYTGNWLEGAPLDRSGNQMRDYSGVAIECQSLPHAPQPPRLPLAHTAARTNLRQHYPVPIRHNLTKTPLTA